MKRYWQLLASLALLSCSGCASQVWYQTGRTPAQAYQDWTDCQTAARATQPATIQLRATLISAMQSDDWKDLAADCMRGKGYEPTRARLVPDAKRWPEY